MRTSPNWYRSTINCCCCTQAWVSIRATTVDNKALKTMPQSALGEDVMPQPVNDAPAYSEAGGGKVQDDQGQQERFKHFNQYLDNPPTCHLWPEGRQQCPKCTGRVRFYCPNCMTFVGKPDQVKIPDLRLPLELVDEEIVTDAVHCPSPSSFNARWVLEQVHGALLKDRTASSLKSPCQSPTAQSVEEEVDVVVTPQEMRRSSGVHVAVVAPKDGRESLPSYDSRSVLLAFPSKGSVCWDELSQEDLAEVRRVVLVDSRWEAASPVLNHPNLRNLRHVRIRDPPAQSRFWRWHISGDGHICTAEAIYFLLKEYQDLRGVSAEGSPLEDILFLFALMRSRIKDSYEHDPSKAGKADPSSESAKMSRRMRNIRLDSLVKRRYRGIEDMRAREGEEAAVAEFCRRRRASRSVYDEKAEEANSKTQEQKAPTRSPSEKR